MRNNSSFFIALSAALVVCGYSSAQPAPTGVDGIMLLSILSNESVQSELKLTNEQKAQVSKLKPPQPVALGPNRSADEVAKVRATMKALSEETNRFVSDSLNAEQQKRLKQLYNQSMGFRLLESKDAQAALALSDEQKKQIKDLGAALVRKSVDLQKQGGNVQERFRAAREFSDKCMQQMLDQLNEDQKKIWSDLVGASFDLKFLRPGG